MGQVSYLEDILERLNENFRRAEAQNAHDYAEAINAIRDDVRQLYELATSDLALVCEIVMKEKRIGTLKDFLKAREDELNVKASEIDELKRKSDGHYKDLQAAICENTRLQNKNRKLNEAYEKLTRENFGAAVDVHSPSSMVRKHKPNG